MGRGSLITISGLDGSGKSTQLSALQDALTAHGWICRVQLFDATSYGATAQSVIDQLSADSVHYVVTRHTIDWSAHYPLIGDFVMEQDLQTPQLALAVACVSAGASLQLGACCFEPLLARGIHILSDRYWYDDLVYRSFWVEPALLRQLYAPLPTPRLALLLDVPPTTTIARNRMRPDARSPLLRNANTIVELRRRFLELAVYEGMQVIDADRPARTVTADLLKAITTATQAG